MWARMSIFRAGGIEMLLPSKPIGSLRSGPKQSPPLQSLFATTALPPKSFTERVLQKRKQPPGRRLSRPRFNIPGHLLGRRKSDLEISQKCSQMVQLLATSANLNGLPPNAPRAVTGEV